MTFDGTPSDSHLSTSELNRPVVSLAQVTKRFQEGAKERTVLDGLSLEMAAGSKVALLGSSGSGKSTLLNILSGLILSDEGTVEVAGHQLHLLSDSERTLFRRKAVGFVFQFFHLVPTLTVEENLRLPLQLIGETASERARASSLLEKVGLLDRAGSLPDRLSGGEQQRVAVARALIHQPALLLADEPTGNLDESTAEKVLDLLETLSSEQGTTLLMVTHSEKVARRCERILKLESGALVDVRA